MEVRSADVIGATVVVHPAVAGSGIIVNGPFSHPVRHREDDEQ